MQVRNVARERLEKGEMSLGVGIRTARTVDIAKMMGAAGWWLFIDLSTGPMSVEFATTIMQWRRSAASIVRAVHAAFGGDTRARQWRALGIVMRVDLPSRPARSSTT
jgi:hypothetical protein